MLQRTFCLLQLKAGQRHFQRYQMQEDVWSLGKILNRTPFGFSGGYDQQISKLVKDPIEACAAHARRVNELLVVA